LIPWLLPGGIGGMDAQEQLRAQFAPEQVDQLRFHGEPVEACLERFLVGRWAARRGGWEVRGQGGLTAACT
jgi:hypothetical protein